VLASEYRGSVPSLRFFFRLLDVQHRGAFGAPEIRFFFDRVRAALLESGHEPVDTANVADEILDMVFPAAPGRVTLNDLRRCRVGAIVCAILFDAQAFLAFDTREELKALGAQGAGGQGDEDPEAALGGLAEDASYYAASFNV
jgi:hypothetical protein